MKALTLKQIKTPLELETRPDLEPAAGEVVVRLQAAALNRRDYWITQGMYPGITLPVVLGSDGAGIVSACGAGADPRWLDRKVILNPGIDWGENEAAQDDRFHILGLPRNGTFATEVAVPASQLHAKPAHLDWREAAALPLGGLTAYRALFAQGALRSGETVVITGIGGGVATFALQFAVAAGANVWVTSSSDEKIRRAVELGAAGGANYKQEGWAQQLAEQAGAPNLIIDSAAGEAYGELIQLAAPGGRIVSYGATAGPPKQLDMFRVFWKQLRLQGSTMGSPTDFAAMLEFVEQHRIRPIIDCVFPLAEGNEAIRQMQRSPQFGKYVLAAE